MFYSKDRNKRFGKYLACKYDGITGMEAATIDMSTATGGIRDLSRKDGQHAVVLSTAELAECSCPDHCDRDHDRD